MIRRGVILTLIALSILATPGSAQVVEELRFRRPHVVYFPRWVWQGASCRVVVVVRNARRTERTFTVELVPAEGVDERMRLPAARELTQVVTVPAEGRVPVVFGPFMARGGLPSGRVIFQANVDGRKARTFFIRTLQGLTDPQDAGPPWLAAAAAVGACLAFAVVLRMLSSPGAWKSPYEIVEHAGEGDARQE